MANSFVKQVPNAITCCNLMCGCMATGAAFYDGNYHRAVVMIVLAATFDFFDGMVARLLGVSSPIGKELDSLADVVSFGVAPSAMVFHLFHHVAYPGWLEPLREVVPYAAFLLAAFSALRLAKFNLDTRQTTQFIGLPTPANALFWASLLVGARGFLESERFNAVFLFLFMLLFCFLLVAEIPLIALKFKSLAWRDNRARYIFLAGCLPCLLLGVTCFSAIIVWYMAVSLASNCRCFQHTSKNA